MQTTNTNGRQQSNNTVINRKGLLTISALVIAIASGFTTVNAYAGDKYQNRDNFVKSLKQLDLTDQQKQDIRSLMKQNKSDRELFRQDRVQLKQELASLIHSDTWQDEAIANLISEQQALRSDQALAKAQSRHAVWNMLAPEQQQQAVDNTAQRTTKRKSRNEMRRFKRLDLTDDQTAQIEAILQSKNAVFAQHKDTLKTLKASQATIIRSTDFDQQAWQDNFDEIQQISFFMQVESAQAKHQIWNLLTEDQQLMIKERMEKRGDKRRGNNRI